jgi:hypothetical protein
MEKGHSLTALVLFVSLALFAPSLNARQTSPGSAMLANTLVAEVNQRINASGLAVHVIVDGKRVHLAQVTALFVVFPALKEGQSIERLVGKRVLIVPPDSRHNRWEVYQDPWRSVDPLALADNVFAVKRVIVSSRLHPVEVSFEGRTIRLQPDEALLVV